MIGIRVTNGLLTAQVDHFVKFAGFFFLFFVSQFFFSFSSEKCCLIWVLLRRCFGAGDQKRREMFFRLYNKVLENHQISIPTLTMATSSAFVLFLLCMLECLFVVVGGGGSGGCWLFCSLYLLEMTGFDVFMKRTESSASTEPESLKRSIKV